MTLEFVNLSKLAEIATFADKAEKAIQNNRFEFENSEVEDLNGNNNGERCYYATLSIKGYSTLSIDGTWTYHDKWERGREVSMKCTREEIFEAFKAQLFGAKDSTLECALSEFERWVKSLPTWKEDAE